MERYRDKKYSRNYGFWSEDEQRAINNSKVAIAGVGGDGFQLGLGLVRMGVNNLSVADPEVFEEQNTNRVPGAIVKNYGRNKAIVFKEMAQEIDPNVNVDVFSDGVTEDNVDEFMMGANLCIDESELRYLHIATMLARTARKLMIPNMTVMNVGFAGVATSFDPDAEKNRHTTFEELMKIPKGMPLDEVKGRDVDFSCYLPYIPSYGDINVFKEVSDGAPLPSIVQGVNIASGIGQTQAFLHMVKSVRNKRPEPIWASSFIYNDAYANCAGVIELPKLSHYRKLITMIGRSALGLNPLASYNKSDRNNRNHE